MLLAALLVLLAAACSPADEQIVVLATPFDDDQIAQGREWYVQYCAACHGANGEGQFPEAPLEPDATGRRGAPPHNGNGHTWHHSDTLLLRYVRDGGFSNPENFYPMPAFGTVLTDEQILQIIAYIKTMWNDEQLERQYMMTQEEAKLFE